MSIMGLDIQAEQGATMALSEADGFIIDTLAYYEVLRSLENTNLIKKSHYLKIVDELTEAQREIIYNYEDRKNEFMADLKSRVAEG